MRKSMIATLLCCLALATGCGESTPEERAVEAVGELAEGRAEAVAAAEGEDELTEELEGEVAEAEAEAAMEEIHDVDAALATMAPTAGNTAAGHVRLSEQDEGTLVHVVLSNLTPESVHGIHVHETGDCSAPDGSSAGGHYAPESHDHGLPAEEEPRHAGDLGNVTADEEGNVSIARVFETISLDEEHPVVGRAVILHANQDVGAQPSGNAGARIACGVIQAVPAGA